MNRVISALCAILLCMLSTAQPPGGGGTTTDLTLCDLHGASSTYTESIDAESTARYGYVRRIQASGCPNHNSQCQKTEICEDGDTEAAVLDKDIKLPAYPCFADSLTNVTCIEDSIAIALNGASIFSQAGNPMCGDAIIAEGATFDACSGHATPDGIYHYHVAPACLLDQLNDSDSTNSNGAHSPQIGWAYDGFPIYGPHGSGGDYIYPCDHDSADSSDCVDACNGHEQHAIDGFAYHYHILGPIGDLTTEPLSPLPGTEMHPYTIGCLRGVPFDWTLVGVQDTSPTCNASRNGTLPDYVPAALDGVTTMYSATSSSDATSAPTSSDTTSAPSSTATGTPSMAPTTASVSSDANVSAFSFCVFVIHLISSFFAL